MCSKGGRPWKRELLKKEIFRIQFIKYNTDPKTFEGK